MIVDVVFHEDLLFLLPCKHREVNHKVEWIGKRSVKDLVESLGVPHTEIGGILVNDHWVSFSYILERRDRILVLPSAPQCHTADNPLYHPDGVGEPLPAASFICDVHLWKLARRLRLMGFDTLFNRGWDDARMAEISHRERRYLLTRDRGLLKRRAVELGLYIRAIYLDEQVSELLHRLNLYHAVAPFARCMVCNGKLKRADMESSFFHEKLKPKIPEKLLETVDEFDYCIKCRKVFWKGTHYEKLAAFLSKHKHPHAIENEDCGPGQVAV